MTGCLADSRGRQSWMLSLVHMYLSTLGCSHAATVTVLSSHPVYRPTGSNAAIRREEYNNWPFHSVSRHCSLDTIPSTLQASNRFTDNRLRYACSLQDTFTCR
ncbi:hypothetical protein EDD16DRAFT_908746 [Pisolithus croceorrhizus]|nr:hypothetical protein EDD16DRAFT_908746 [Pisolithus croceorrhizus]